MKRKKKGRSGKGGGAKKKFLAKSLADQRELSMRAVETFALSGRWYGTLKVTAGILGLCGCLHVEWRYCGCSEDVPHAVSKGNQVDGFDAA